MNLVIIITFVVVVFVVIIVIVRRLDRISVNKYCTVLELAHSE